MQNKLLILYYIRYLLITAGLLVNFHFDCIGQSDPIRRQIVNQACIDLRQHYYERKLVKKMCDSLTYKFDQGKFNAAVNTDEFLYLLTSDMQAISGDMHLEIISLNKHPFDDKAYELELSKLSRKELQNRAKRGNKKLKEYEKTLADGFEFGEISILPGNVGYLKIKAFKSKIVGRKGEIPLNKVVQFFKKPEVLIIDLRDNLGGFSAALENFLSNFASEENGYLFTMESFHRQKNLNGVIQEDTFYQKCYSPEPHKPGMLSQKKIILLINYRTFSAAKEAACFLKNLKPGTTVIGECSIKGGNSFGDLPVENEYYKAYIPFGQIVFEHGNGKPVSCQQICPDIAISADSVYWMGLSVAGVTDFTGQNTIFLNKEKLQLFSKIENASFYAGNFMKAQVIHSDGYLILHYGEFVQDTMQQLSRDMFFTKKFSRIEFTRGVNNQVTSIKLSPVDYDREEVFFKRD